MKEFFVRGICFGKDLKRNQYSKQYKLFYEDNAILLNDIGEENGLTSVPAIMFNQTNYKKVGKGTTMYELRESVMRINKIPYWNGIIGLDRYEQHNKES